MASRGQIKIKRQKLSTVTSFEYIGAVVSDDDEWLQTRDTRIAQATAALIKLKPIWRDNNISLGSKVELMSSLVISILLYACESWTLTAELKIRTQAFEMRCYRRLLNISYKDHVTSEEVRRKIQVAIGEYDELLTLDKKRKLRWFSHAAAVGKFDQLLTLVKKWKLGWFGHFSRSYGLARQSYRRQGKEKEKEADRRIGGKTISKSGQE